MYKKSPTSSYKDSMVDESINEEPLWIMRDVSGARVNLGRNLDKATKRPNIQIEANYD